MKALNEVFTDLHAFVVDECMKRGIKGAFAAADLSTHEIRSQYAYALMKQPLREGEEGKPDANFLGIALSKLAEVAVRRRNTGTSKDVIGEVRYQGGRLSEDGKFAYAFSGADQEEDDKLMQLVEEHHKSL